MAYVSSTYKGKEIKCGLLGVPRLLLLSLFRGGTIDVMNDFLRLCSLIYGSGIPLVVILSPWCTWVGVASF